MSIVQALKRKFKLNAAQLQAFKSHALLNLLILSIFSNFCQIWANKHM